MGTRLFVAIVLTSFFAIPLWAQKTDASPSTAHENFEAVVLPITELKAGVGVGLRIEDRAGTGFCLDPACRFIGTNYHVAMLAKPRKIGGETVFERYLDTGPEDDGATLVEGPSMPGMKYNIGRDLAIFELERPVPNRRGVSFFKNDLFIGQGVDIYAFPRESMIRSRKLLQVHGTFRGETSSGLFAFDYDASSDRTLRPGASGGIVVDSKTQQIVGVLNAIDGTDRLIAFAVPVRALEEFVTRVQPFLAESIFPSTKRISPVSEDVYPKFVPTPASALQHRTEESIEVRSLRTKAQLLAEGMRDFIAVQSLAWGSQNNEPVVESKYEVQVLQGDERFREFPDGKKELQEVSFPPLPRAVVPGSEWSELPLRVGTDLDLKINQAPDAVVNGRSIKVFQYWASVEDGACTVRTINFGLFTTRKTFVTACYGEVWTDENSDILRISEHFEFASKMNLQAVVTYGWLKKTAEEPRIVPFTLAMQTEHKNKVYWCRSQFTNYRVFSSRVRIIEETGVASGPLSQ